MTNTNLIFEVNQKDFEELVLIASSKYPIIVDFWAPWCTPCHILSPLLENIVRSYKGRIALAKVNVDENPQLASLFGIMSIPSVKIFKDGEIVEEFVGVLPEDEIRRYISSVIPTEADLLCKEGDRLKEKGKIYSAEEKYLEALKITPSHPGACLRLAELNFKKGEYTEAKELISRIRIDRPEYEEAEKILWQIRYKEECEKSGGLEACKKKSEEEPENLDAHFAYTTCLAAEGRYEEALEEFLKIIQLNKNYQNGAARKVMLEIFSIVGQRTDLVKKYRSRLASAIY